MPTKKKAEGKEKATVTDEATVELETSEGVAEKVKEPEIELVEELIRYQFTDQEMVKLAESIGELMHKIDRLNQEKKATSSQYDAEIKRVDLDLQEVAQSIRDGFDMRRVECYVVKDYLERKAYYLRADRYSTDFLKGYLNKVALAVLVGHVEPVKVRDLKPWELQREIPFEGEEDENL